MLLETPYQKFSVPINLDVLAFLSIHCKRKCFFFPLHVNALDSSKYAMAKVGRILLDQAAREVFMFAKLALF